MTTVSKPHLFLLVSLLLTVVTFTLFTDDSWGTKKEKGLLISHERRLNDIEKNTILGSFKQKAEEGKASLGGKNHDNAKQQAEEAKKQHRLNCRPPQPLDHWLCLRICRHKVTADWPTLLD